MNKLIDIEKEQIEETLKTKKIPSFKSGDTLKVNVYVTEGNKERIQAFEGVCIARSNRGFNSTFTVRKVSHGEGVERVFPLFSPIIEKIEVIRKGDVRRAKLYFLRDRTGKRARIADRDRGDEADQYAMIEEEQVEETNSKENENPDSNKDEAVEKVNTESKAPAEAEEPEESPAEEGDKKTDEQSKS